MSSVKQVIVVRTAYPDGRGGTFKPRLGKLAAQVAHASMKVFFDRGKVVHNLTALDEHGGCPKVYGGQQFLIALGYEGMREWVEGLFTKVVVGVETEEDLLRVHELAKAAGLPTALIQDAGLTEFKGVPTYTTCAVGPAAAEKIDPITGPEGAVRTRLL